MFRTIAAAFAALALTAATVAAESGGTVTGTIGGQEVELTIWPEQSDYDGGLDVTWILVSLIARGDALAQQNLGALYFQIEAVDLPGNGHTFVELQTSIRDTTPSRAYVGKYLVHSEEKNALALTVTSAVEDDGLLAVSGTVTGVLTSVESVDHRNPDPDDTLDVDLTFDVTVAKMGSD